jgi:hypothetical protein
LNLRREPEAGVSLAVADIGDVSVGDAEEFSSLDTAADPVYTIAKLFSGAAWCHT